MFKRRKKAYTSDMDIFLSDVKSEKSLESPLKRQEIKKAERIACLRDSVEPPKKIKKFWESF